MPKYLKTEILILAVAMLLCLQPVNSRLFMPGITNYFACDKVHIVQETDTCWSVSLAYKIPIQLIKWKNDIISCRELRPGMRLCVSGWI